MARKFRQVLTVYEGKGELQCDRATNGAEIRGAMSRDPATGELQCDRATNGAEIHAAERLLWQADHASM